MRTLALASEIACKRARLSASHMAPLVAYVQELRSLNIGYVPDFDPDDGGVAASILFLFEKPGPATTKSTFISRDNDDRSAEATYRFMEAAGIPRKLTVTWNTIPAWNGTIHITRQERSEGLAHLARLVGLLPHLKVCVLVGLEAAHSAYFLEGIGLPIVRSDHPSPRVKASWPERWAAIPDRWRESLRYL